MSIVIRNDVSQHMKELVSWLKETESIAAEGMDGFFTKRVDTYEAHMLV